MAGKLTDPKIRAAKPAAKTYKLPKEQGLTVAVEPSGKKRWLHFITINGRETTLAYGIYPDVTLKEARERRDETRRLVRQGIDPVQQKKAEKSARADSFEAIATEWLDAGCPGRRLKAKIKPDTIEQYRNRLETYVFPYHGSTPIREITTTAFHSTLKRLVSKRLLETAERVRSVSSRVFKYAIATGRAEHDPAGVLAYALPKPETQHFAAITDEEGVGKLLRAIWGYQGQPQVCAALKLAPYVFVRPGELRSMEWTELDLDKAEWCIPAEKTKMNREHLVPLAPQCVEILKALQPVTGKMRYVFPGIRRPSERCISENTLNSALRAMGYTSEQMTAHGFRSMASTRLNELGFDPEIIEVQLAHMDRDRIRAIYNRVHAASYLKKRREMMMSWARYLDGLRLDTSAKVVALRG